MIQHILTDTGEVLPLQTIQQLTPAEINSSVKDEKRKRFNLIIREKFGNSLRPPTPISEAPSKYDDIEEPSKIPEADDSADYNSCIDSEVLVPQNGEHMRSARVVDNPNHFLYEDLQHHVPEWFNKKICRKNHCRTHILPSRRRQTPLQTYRVNN